MPTSLAASQASEETPKRQREDGRRREGKTAGLSGNGENSRRRRKRSGEVRAGPEPEQNEKTILCLTQNVRGLLKDTNTIDDWFSGIRGHTELGFVDVALLQETRATAKWQDVLRRKYGEGWGLRGEQRFEQWSFWGPTPEPAGGVAILVRPDGRATNPRPLWQEHWSQWFMAIQFEVAEITHTVINIYGPTGRRDREEAYAALARHPKPGGRLLVGGDFNCTLDDSLDRSYSAQQTHDSDALRELLRAWDLCDALQLEQDEIHTEQERRDFHATKHTYRYQVGETEMASSRLDRHYIERSFMAHVRQTEVVSPVGSSDHDGVLIQLADNKDPPPPRQRRRRARIRYPLPHGTGEIVAAISKEHISRFRAAGQHAPAVNTGRWVKWKIGLRRSCLWGIRVSLKKQTRAHKQRCRRLRRALRALVPFTGTNVHSVDGTIEGITKGMEGLAINCFARAKAIRAELIRITRARSARRRQRRFDLYAHGHGEAERAFHARFRQRQGQLASMPDDATATSSRAARLAADWKQITQRGDRSATRRNSFFDTLPKRLPVAALRGLDDEFTEDEVKAAIRACPRRKAPGPDGIPNDWYRDHEDDVAPLLVDLFNGWHQSGILPSSFRKALVACIPKISKPRSGLDFRPIALLDTDYKIFSRLLLNRLRPFLPELVSETQYGFVPGRQVHDALDVFHALQALVKEGTAPTRSLAVSLDFAKAYDTLDRPFLLQVLERLGCPPLFIQAVRQMHLATTAEYMADADISAEQRVLNGIRQGCPLAPTLFVLAVDTLYEAVRACPDARGIPLPSGTEVRIAGFADDTTLYVPSEAELPALLELLQAFEDASGLGINLNKCIAIALHGSVRPQGDLGLPLAAASDMSRLLGGQVSTHVLLTQVWDLTLQQMRTRLHLAELKTTNVLQRVKLVKAIVVPKFTFVARHHWPTKTHVNRVHLLIKNFVWKGTLEVEPTPGRAWMGEDTASLPVVDGGLGMPDLTHVLQELSVQVVARWAAPNEGLRSEIGSIRLRHHKAPEGRPRLSRKPAPRTSLQKTLAGTGLQTRKALDSQPREPREIELARDLLRATGRGSSEHYTWRNERLWVDYGPRRDEMRALQHWQAGEYGDLHVAALLEAPLDGEDILITADGLPLAPADLAGLAPRGASIGDVVDIQWSGDDRISFYCKTRPYPLPDLQARAFRRLCDTLVYNYPMILRDPGPVQDVQCAIPTLDIWTLERAHGKVELWWSPLGDIKVLAGIVTSTAAASKTARQLTSEATLSFLPHVWLEPPRSLWRGVATTSPKDVRALVAHHSHERGIRAVEERVARWTEMDNKIATALSDLSWDEILKVPGASASHCLLLHRLKGARLTGWAPALDSVGCPHCPTAQNATGLAHTFWSCPMAQRLWTALRARWDQLSTNRLRWDEPLFLRNVFSLRLTTMPDLLWDLPALARLPAPSTRETSATHQALQATWRRQVMATFHVIWRWRMDATDLDQIWSPAEAIAYQDGYLRSTLVDPRWPRTPDGAPSCHTKAALDVLRQADPERPIPPADPATELGQYLLFFDGGSRGNPGAGGSGAVVIATGHRGTSASIVWSAAMSAASVTTTNNQAEYDGVVVGLRAARQHGWTPLEVVGDSQLILGQLRKYRPPSNPTLCDKYAEARRLGDALGVRHWHHHVRAYNKMADAAANAAMDERASSQISITRLDEKQRDLGEEVNYKINKHRFCEAAAKRAQIDHEGVDLSELTLEPQRMDKNLKKLARVLTTILKEFVSIRWRTSWSRVKQDIEAKVKAKKLEAVLDMRDYVRSSSWGACGVVLGSESP